jgi:hypothetical protein
VSFTADYPGAIVYPAHSTNTLGPPNNPRGFVLHTPEEPADGYAGTPVWFARPNVGGSTTYFVSYLGFIYQCVPEPVAAIANGVLGKPYPAWANPNISLNRQSLSVEIEGYAATIANTISPAQKTALLNLIRHRCQAHGIPIDRAHIIGHYEVANNRTDPGTLDIDAIVAELQEDTMGMTPDERALLDIIQGQVEQLITFHQPGPHGDTIDVDARNLLGILQGQVQQLLDAAEAGTHTHEATVTLQ